MNISSEFERKLACGGFDPLIRDLAVKIKRQWDPKGKSGYEIEDLMQEAYLKIVELEAAQRYEGSGRRGASKATFMYACAKNRLIDIERSRTQTKKAANLEFVSDIYKQAEKRQCEQNAGEDPLERLVTELSLKDLCRALAEISRADGEDAPDAELIFRILSGTAQGKTAKKIAAENSLSAYRLQKIKRQIFRHLKGELAPQVREILGGERGQIEKSP